MSETTNPAADAAPFEGWISRAEAARVIGVVPHRVDQLFREHQLPAAVTPVGRLYRRADIEAFAAHRAAASNPSAATFDQTPRRDDREVAAA
jgi:hypothetical protein